MRRAQSSRPQTYRCPFCGELLHAMSEHVLIAPEGRVDERRHAHTACVLAERKAGRLRTEDEARRRTDLVTSKSQGEKGAGIVGRLWRRLHR
jgi:hypothetical protein